MELLQDFPVVIQIPVAWGHMDAMQHVNNVSYFRYFESARVAYLERLEMFTSMHEGGIGPILASAQCRFKVPLTYPDTVWAGVRVAEIGADRFTLECHMASQRLQRVAAEAKGVVVSYDYRQGVKAPLLPELRQRILEVERTVGRMLIDGTGGAT